jgi:hypothetical protein
MKPSGLDSFLVSDRWAFYEVRARLAVVLSLSLVSMRRARQEAGQRKQVQVLQDIAKVIARI